MSAGRGLMLRPSPLLLVLLALLGGGCRSFIPAAGQADPGGIGDWRAQFSQKFTQMCKDIEADLNFHENEGLENFAPDAAAQVQLLRQGMQGSAR